MEKNKAENCVDTQPEVEKPNKNPGVKLRDNEKDPVKSFVDPEDPELAEAKEAILRLAETYRKTAQEYIKKASTLETLAENCSPGLLAILEETRIDLNESKWKKLSVPPMVLRALKAWDILRGKKS